MSVADGRRVSRPGIGGPVRSRIVVVEDNEDDAMQLRRAIAKSGVDFSLEVVGDGEQALAAVERWRGQRPAPGLPHLIVLDLGLPCVAGKEVLRRLREDPVLRSVPVVVLTGGADEAQQRECVKLGANLYLTKPISFLDVIYVLLGVHSYWAEAP